MEESTINEEGEDKSSQQIDHSQAETAIQEQKNMEVIQPKRKKFKEYFIEFLMLFLAVTLGFFAESYREGLVERSNEKEYIKSMIEDAQTDIENFDQAITLNEMRISKLDSIMKLSYNYHIDGSDDEIFYMVFRKCLRHPDFVSPTERTMMQLKNAGGMRLIQNKTASESIIQYDDFAKKLDDQKFAYEQGLTNLISESMNLINYNYYNLDDAKNKNTQILASNEVPKLMNPDKDKLIEFGNNTNFYRAVVFYYTIILNDGKQQAIDLVKTLKKEYKMK